MGMEILWLMYPICNFTKICSIIIRCSNHVLVNGKNGDNGQIAIDRVLMASALEKESAVQVVLVYVMDLNEIWKSVTKTYVTIGQQKVGQIGHHGETVQNHAGVALESDDEFVKIVITIVMIQGIGMIDFDY